MKIKRIIYLLITLVMVAMSVLSGISSTAWAADTDTEIKVDGHTYTVSSDGTLAKYEGNGGALIIPEAVTSIGDRVFRWNGNITSVTLHDKVTGIGASAFENCIYLSSIYIPKSVTSIGASAFANCSLASITIPDGLKQIADKTFLGCDNLKEIVIPGSVTRIGSQAFLGCWGLKSITLFEGLNEISSEAFSECYSLESIAIPKSVTKIGEKVFSSCGALKLTFYGKSFNYILTGLFVGSPLEKMTVYCYPGSTAEMIATGYPPGRIKVEYLKPYHTVIFDTDDGTGIAKQYVVPAWDEDKTTAPAVIPMKEHNRFMGWYEDKECSKEWDFNTKTVSGDVIIYAGYEKATTYRITYNTNGGKDVPGTFVFADELVNKPNDTYKENYTFAGWYKDEEFSNQWDFKNDKVTKDTILYAKWEVAYVTVYFNSMGGTEVPPQTVASGTLLGTIPKPTRAGYKFAGWYADQSYVVEKDDDFPLMYPWTLYAKWDNGTSGGSDEPDDSSTPAETILVPSDNSGISIDLSAETIELASFTVAAYSVNGGTKWIKGLLPEDPAKFSKLFDKEMTLWLSDTYNDKDIKEGKVVVEKKGVPDYANIVKFPKINARPKANSEKLAAYYSDSTWTLMTKPTKLAAATEPKLVYEYVKGNQTDGKLPEDTTWLLSLDSGFRIRTKPPKDDKSKNVYYFRSTASASKLESETEYTNTPASKAFKISPAYYGTVLKYKIDYKNELLKLKKGDMYSVNSGTDWTEITEQKGISLNVSDYITSGTSIMVKKGTIGTKPRSDIQTIVPVSRMVMEDKELTCAKGKITDTTELKKYEILGTDSKGNEKWGSLPKITESKEFVIRLKTDAKFSKDAWTGNAASTVGKLTIMYGVYDESGKTPKSGIIGAVISMDSGSN